MIVPAKKDIAYRRFFSAKSELVAECDSYRILISSIGDNYRFTQFKNSSDKAKNLFILFQHTKNDIISSCDIASSLTGEWFARIDLGREVKIGKNVNLLAHGGITLGRDSTIEDNVQIITISHGLHPSQRKFISCAPIIIEEDTCIGEGSIIINASLNGTPTIIGRGAKVLPWSVVTSDVMPKLIVAGRPAKPIQEIEHLSQYLHTSALNYSYGCLKIQSMQHAQSKITGDLFIISPFFIENHENLSLGKNAFFNRNSVIKAQGSVRIGDNILLAPGAVIHAHSIATISIKDDVWIGAGARVTAENGQHLRIGSGSIIAAGATVTQDIPDMTIVVGNNRHIKHIDDSFLQPIPPIWRDIEYLEKRTERMSVLKEKKHYVYQGRPIQG